MKKWISAMFAIFALLLLAAAGCGGTGSVVTIEDPDREITTITFFGNKYEPENVEVIEEIISGFMEENPDIRISYESLKGTEYYDALEKRMKAGKGDDVFMVNHDILLELEGQVADLSGLRTITGFTERMLDQMEENGKIFWVPTTVSAFGLYCNMDLLEEHGQKVPENLGEWEAVCSYFAGRGILPVIANNDISLKTLAIGRSFFRAYQEGRQAEIFEQINDGEAALSEYLYSGFTVAEEFIQKGYVDKAKALATKKTSEDLQEFILGESPFMLTGAWASGRVREMNPDFEFQVYPLPVLDDGALLVINPDTRLSVNAGSEHLGAAMKFVEYFTAPENIQKFADQQSSFSPLIRGVPSSEPEIQPLYSCYAEGRTVIGTDALLNLPIWELTAGASQKLLSGEQLGAVMEWLDRQAGEDERS